MFGTAGQATGGIQATLGLEWLPSTSPLAVDYAAMAEQARLAAGVVMFTIFWWTKLMLRCNDHSFKP